MNVSLTSFLTSYGYGTTTTEASGVVSAAIEKLAKQTEAKASQSTSGTAVSISAEALAAAAAKEDEEKDYAVLVKEVRAALDSQYAGGTAKGSADLGELSGRALAVMALNKEGQFSPAESRAAKLALREETRLSFVSVVGKGADIGAIANFSKQLAAQYDAMSPEEREARGWTEKFRDTNVDFAANLSMPSLFDQI